MVPMSSLPFRLCQRVGGYAPFTGGSLPRQYKAGHAGASQLLQLRRQELAASALRVDYAADLIVEVANGGRTVAMPVPPKREQLGDNLSPVVAFLSLADTIGRVLASKRQQWIAHPPAPLLEATERTARLEVLVQATPAPDRQDRVEELRPPVRDFGADIGREASRLRVA